MNSNAHHSIDQPFCSFKFYISPFRQRIPSDNCALISLSFRSCPLPNRSVANVNWTMTCSPSGSAFYANRWNGKKHVWITMKRHSSEWKRTQLLRNAHTSIAYRFPRVRSRWMPIKIWRWQIRKRKQKMAARKCNFIIFLKMEAVYADAAPLLTEKWVQKIVFPALTGGLCSRYLFRSLFGIGAIHSSSHSPIQKNGSAKAYPVWVSSWWMRWTEPRAWIYSTILFSLIAYVTFTLNLIKYIHTQFPKLASAVPMLGFRGSQSRRRHSTLSIYLLHTKRLHMHDSSAS